MNPSRPAIGRLAAGVGTLLLVLAAGSATAQLATNGLALPTPPALPSAAPSMLRVLGALMLVIGLFIGGAFLFTRTRQFGFNRGVTPGSRCSNPVPWAGAMRCLSWRMKPKLCW